MYINSDELYEITMKKDDFEKLRNVSKWIFKMMQVNEFMLEDLLFSTHYITGGDLDDELRHLNLFSDIYYLSKQSNKYRTVNFINERNNEFTINLNSREYIAFCSVASCFSNNSNDNESTVISNKEELEIFIDSSTENEGDLRLEFIKLIFKDQDKLMPIVPDNLNSLLFNLYNDSFVFDRFLHKLREQETLIDNDLSIFE